MEARSFKEDLEEIYSYYYDAGGVTYLGRYMKKDEPSAAIQFWVLISTCIILPQIMVVHARSILFDDVPVAIMFLSICLALDQFQVALKSHYIRMNCKRFQETMIDMESFHCVQHLGKEATESMLGMCQLIKLIRTGINASCYFTIISWIIFPVVASPRALFLGEDMSSMSKVFPPEYPFSVDFVPVAQLIYCLESLSCFVILTYFAGTNVILVTYILVICQMYTILNHSISPSNKTGPMSLRLFAIDHERLLRISNEAKKLFSPIMALQMGASVTTMSLAIYEMTLEVDDAITDNELIQFFTMSKKLLYPVLVFYELLFFCWLSTTLEDSCLSVREGVYNSIWYTNCKNTYQEVIIISMRALKAVKLDAISIVTLNLGTCVEVLRLAYSYYTCLQRVD